MASLPAALIFDVDGTLAETERDGHRVAFNQAFHDFDLPWQWPVGLYGELLNVAGGKERIAHYIDRYQPQAQLPLPLEELTTALHRAKTHYFKALVESGGIFLRPGVKRLLQEARSQGVRLAIATTSASDNVIPLLQQLLGPESPNWFEIIASGDRVTAKKPDPEVYHQVLDNLELAPSQCLVFEDSQQGLKAAVTAGLPTVVTVNDYTRHQPLPGATLVISHLGEPHRPFEVLWGNAGEAYYFSLALAHSLLAGRPHPIA